MTTAPFSFLIAGLISSISFSSIALPSSSFAASRETGAASDIEEITSTASIRTAPAIAIMFTLAKNSFFSSNL